MEGVKFVKDALFLLKYYTLYIPKLCTCWPPVDEWEEA